MIDHIYLFNNEDEIRGLFNLAGLEILEEKNCDFRTYNTKDGREI